MDQRETQELKKQWLDCLGGQRVLLIGDDIIPLMTAALESGADISALAMKNAAPAVRKFPGRVDIFSGWKFSYPDKSFDSVLALDALDSFSADILPDALKEMQRVSRHGIMITTQTHGVGSIHKTAFSINMRRSLSCLEAIGYETMELQPARKIILLESIPEEAARIFSMERLLASRDLHMDMTREIGRRSDAHMVRYNLAASLVKPGDTVVDAACGLGYGAAILGRVSRAEKITGIDIDGYSTDYATANFGAQNSRLEFRQGDVADLGFLADDSVDLVTSFETIEHVPDYEALLKEVLRILKPGGRIIASVPDLWVDETGRDPNPSHLHVFDWQKFCSIFAGEGWQIERRHIQTAGGNAIKLPNAKRQIRELPIDQSLPDSETEWCLLTARKISRGQRQ